MIFAPYFSGLRRAQAETACLILAAPRGRAVCSPEGQSAWAGTVVCRVMNPGSCPRAIGTGLRYSLLKLIVLANYLYLNATIKRAANALVKTFLRIQIIVFC